MSHSTLSFLFQNYTQYIPLSIYDLQTWMGSPSIFVYDCSNAGLIVKSFKQFALQREQELEVRPTLTLVGAELPFPRGRGGGRGGRLLDSGGFPFILWWGIAQSALGKVYLMTKDLGVRGASFMGLILYLILLMSFLISTIMK